MAEQMGFEIVGQGLAGCCLGWQLRWKGVEFGVLDEGWNGAASRVAAGLLNPVTGKNFQPSWRIAEFLPEALEFYRQVEKDVGRQLWFPLPVLRLVAEKDWAKVARKIELPEVERWVAGVEEHYGEWRAAVTLKGGGRLDARGFCEASGEVFGGDGVREGTIRVHCEGAAGLIRGRIGPHRCAKGEILSLRIPGADESRILVGGGGWLVPVGAGVFKAGATYEWEQLDGEPSSEGRTKVEQILARLGVGEYELLAHEAGVRPIIRQSKPLIGRLDDGTLVFNGLGSKGSLYAPGVARRLAEYLVDGRAIEGELEVGGFLKL